MGERPRWQRNDNHFDSGARVLNVVLGTAQPKDKNVKGFWEERFNALAVFNAEMARGVMRTAEYTEKMRVMQQEYDEKLRTWSEECGVKVLSA